MKTDDDFDIKREELLNLLSASSIAYSKNTSGGEKLIKSDDMLLDVLAKIITTKDVPIVAFRGSQSLTDALVDIQTNTQNLSDYFSFISREDDLPAHSGFLKSVANIYNKLKNELREIDEFDLTGHSYGSGMQTIFNYVYFLDTGKLPRYSIAFGSPRVFAGDISKVNNKIKLLRIQNFNDMITYIPSKSLTTDSVSMAVGGALGASSGLKAGSSRAMALGALVGGFAGYSMSADYKHVGEGIILFPTKNVTYNLDYGAGQENTGDKSYIVVPKGTDVLRNPLDINGFISGLIQSYLGGIGMNILLNRMFPTTPALERFLDSEYGQTALGRLNLFLESTDVAVLQQKISSSMLERLVVVNDKDKSISIIQKFWKRLQTDMMRKTMLKIEEDTQDILMSVELGIMDEEEAEDALEDINYLKADQKARQDVVDREIYGEEKDFLAYFGYKEGQKLTGTMKDAFIRIHLIYIANMAGFLLKSMEAFSRVQGHLTTAYIDNISQLPFYLGELPTDKGFPPLTAPTDTLKTAKFRENILAQNPEIIGFFPLEKPLGNPVFVLY